MTARAGVRTIGVRLQNCPWLMPLGSVPFGTGLPLPPRSGRSASCTRALPGSERGQHLDEEVLDLIVTRGLLPGGMMGITVTEQ